MDKYEKRTPIALATLYACIENPLGLKGEIDYSRYASNRNIFVNTGTVTIRASNSASQPILLSQMPVLYEDVTGFKELSILPKWMAVIQKTGSSTEVVLSGIDVISKGSIS